MNSGKTAAKTSSRGLFLFVAWEESTVAEIADADLEPVLKLVCFSSFIPGICLASPVGSARLIQACLLALVV